MSAVGGKLPLAQPTQSTDINGADLIGAITVRVVLRFVKRNPQRLSPKGYPQLPLAMP
jgi:hypothetical protein